MPQTKSRGMKPRKRYRRIVPRPRWAEHGGVWYPATYVNKKGTTPMLRWRPSVNSICEPLLGASMYAAVENDRKIIGVRFPEMESRLQIFHEGLELVWVFRRRTDLFALATYRRQVTETGDMPLDILLLLMADRLNLSTDNWKRFAERMPDDSWVKQECEKRSVPVTCELLAVAAAE